MRRSEGGMGGKKGHSNMTHWDYTANVKDDARSVRRRNDVEAIDEQLEDRTEALVRRTNEIAAKGLGRLPGTTVC